MLQERDECRQTIFHNLLCAFLMVLDTVVDELNLEKASEFSDSLEEDFEFVSNTRQYFQAVLQQIENREVLMDADDTQTLPLKAMRVSYANGRIQQAISKGNEYCLHDNFH